MNKNIYRVVWSLVRGAWVVAGEWARAGRKSSSPRRQNRQRARRGVAAMVGGSILAQALLPLSALAQGAPTLRPARVAQEEAGQDAAWTRKLAAQAESLARRQAERQPGARVDGDYLKREAQAQVNDVLRDGVNLARESGLPFLRNLQGGLSHDFESGRTSLQLNTIDEVYRAGRNTGLLQLGAHNQNDRPTANAGAVYRREVNDALMVGANGFLDYEFGKQHLRGSVGLEVIAPEFSLYGNVYAPLSDWKGAKRNNRREEKPASGMDVGVGYRPAFAPGLSLSATHFRWNGAEVDYFDNGRTQAGAKGFKVGVEYRPVSLVSVGLEQTKVIGGGRETRMQLGLNINLSEPLSKQLRHDASGTPAFSPDARRHALVERENRIVLNTRRKEIILPLVVSEVSTLQADGRVTVIGATQPFATVTVRMPDGTTGTATADASGRFAYTSAGDQPSGVLALRARNAEGDSSREVTYRYVDEVVLGDLQVAVMALVPLPADRALEVRGKTEPKIDVKVSFPNGESVLAKADAKGLFTVRSTRKVAQGKVLVQATHPQTRKEARAVADYLPPATLAPTIDAVTAQADTGRVTVTGQAEPGAQVDVHFPDGTAKTVDAGADGAYAATSDGDMVSGDIRVQAVDKAGGKSPETIRAYVDTVDKTAPVVPTIADVATDAKSGHITVTGMTEPGAEVVVSFPDGTRKTVVAGDDGAYTATSDGDMVAGDIRVQAIDKAGGKSPEATRHYDDAVDITPPAAPTIANVATDAASGRVTVAGVAEPGANVAVNFPDGTRKTVVAGGDGAYTATSDRDMVSGDIRVQAADKAGNQSPETTRAYADAVDKTAPEVPTIANVTTDAKSGRITVTGMAEPGVNVAVDFPDGTRKSVVADGAGAYTVTSDRDMVSGDIHAQATDKVGNQSPEATRHYGDTTDITPPAAPTIDNVATDATSGRVTAAGVAEPGANVTVNFPDGTRKTVVAGGDGAYTATSDRDMVSGDIRVQATDKAGNQSPEATRAYADAVDRTAPEVPTVTHVATDAKSGRITVTGMAEPGANVTVNFPDGTRKTVVAGGDGAYAATSDRDMVSGDIRVQATDKAGNRSPEATRAYADTVDTTPPAVPTITDVTTDASNGRITVTGVAESGANVTVDFPDGTRKTVVAGGDGAYTATSDRDMVSGDVRVQAIDKGGNHSPEATRAYADAVDKTAPEVPTITNVTTDAASGRITVTGMAEPGANVAVNFPDGTRKTVVADGAGAYAADSDGDMVAGDIHVQATDKAGNRSPEGTRAYVDTVDKTPSAAPTIARVTTDRSSGVVTVAGTADPDNDVTVQFPDGGRKTVKAGKDGSYSVTSDNDIFSGIIQVSARNPAGNASPEVRQDYRDEFVPANAITNMETNSRNGIVTVSGKTSPDATVVVSFPGGDEARTRAKGDGTFSVSSPMDVPRGVVSLSTEVDGVRTVVATRTYEDKFTKGGQDYNAILPYTPGFNGVSTSDTSAVLLSVPQYFYSGGAPVAKIMPPDAHDSEFTKRAAAAMRVQVTSRRNSSEYDIRVSWPAGTFTPADVGQQADLVVKIFDVGTGKFMLAPGEVRFRR
ncbi:Ig-like domain-containing protein [Bordetella bronchiseptica]|uniref:Ig-like domain-containing protein n=1 Tax=Bordetella bronchiseptica TaxID=518 RepID=UPI0013F6155E|nr:Ig-like domain-containing protein [Bordetella bronchiseptica]